MPLKLAFSTISPKHQTTLNAGIMKALQWSPGMQLRQFVEGGRLILEPRGDISTVYGSLKSKQPFTSIERETTEMEKAVGQESAGQKPS